MKLKIFIFSFFFIFYSDFSLAAPNRVMSFVATAIFCSGCLSPLLSKPASEVGREPVSLGKEFYSSIEIRYFDLDGGTVGYAAFADSIDDFKKISPSFYRDRFAQLGYDERIEEIQAQILNLENKISRKSISNNDLGNDLTEIFWLYLVLYDDQKMDLSDEQSQQLYEIGFKVSELSFKQYQEKNMINLSLISFAALRVAFLAYGIPEAEVNELVFRYLVNTDHKPNLQEYGL